jgi:hypothetical protein
VDENLVKKQPKRSVLVAARLITAVVSLLGAEGMLGLLGYPSWRAQLGAPSEQDEYEADPVLGWRNHAGVYDLVDAQRGNVFRYTFWSRGRRATSAREAEGSGRPVVAFYGDSYVLGFGLTDSATSAWIFQRRHPEWTVENFGTADYGTYQSYLSMKRSAQSGWRVFYLLNGFHEERNVAAASWIRMVKQPPPGFFFPYAVLSGGSLEGRKTEGNLVWPLSRRLRTVAMVEDYYDMARAWRRMRDKQRVTEMLLAKMNETMVGRGAQFTVIVFDMAEKQRAAYRQFLASRGIAFIDCGRPELGDRSLRLADGHPNQWLNEMLAGWIEPKQVTVNDGR